MAAKSFDFDFVFGPRTFRVVADAEGEARYMVRMAEIKPLPPGALRPAEQLPAYRRVGYLTGCRRRWVAEYGSKDLPLTSAATSAKEACFYIAGWAITQAPFGYIHPQPAAPGARIH